MASGERRLGTSRRGMTVLGKIPTPSVPKPINLPSQRSENRGLDANVEIVPRGTFSWGNTGSSNATSISKAGSSGIITSSPISSGVWNGGLKNLTSGNDVRSPSESNCSSSSGNGTTAATTVWGSSAKAQAHVQEQSSGFRVVPMEAVIPDSKESLPQHNESLFNQITAGVGTVGHLDGRPHPGAVPGHVPCPKGLQNPAGDHHTFTRQCMPPAGTALPVGVAPPHSGSLQHEVCFHSIGIPHYRSPNNRDMVLVRTADNPSIYKSFQPHLTPVASFPEPSVFGSYWPQTRTVKQFATSGDPASAGMVDMRTKHFTSDNKVVVQERGSFCDPGKNPHKYSGGQLGTIPRDQGGFGLHRDVDTYCDMASMNTQKSEWKHTTPGSIRSQNHFNEGAGHVKQGVASFVNQVPERRIILLTKNHHTEAQKPENSINNATLLPDVNEGSDSCGQETGLLKLEVKNQSSDNGILSKVKGTKILDEIIENEKVDGLEVTESTKEVRSVSIANQDINCVKEELSKVETGKNKLGSSGTPSSTSTISNENVKSEHDGKAGGQGHRGKPTRRTRKGAIQGGLEPVGAGSQAACDAPIKNIIAEDVALRDNQKLKTKVVNHKSEKAWRPKSPILDTLLAADTSSSQAAGGERISEKNCAKGTDRCEPLQECKTEEVVDIEASSSLQKKKARKWQNIHCLSNSDARSLSAAFNSHQSEIAGCAIDHVTEFRSERDTSKDPCSSHACNTSSVSHGLTADAFDFMETDCLSQSKAKGRHKAEKEWRPKPSAVEVIASTDNVFQSQGIGANVILLPVSNNPTESNHELNFVEEQEGPQTLDTYDYEGQRARLKEIAAQRAKQRRKEEEENARERKAKALAKLAELERRTMANATCTEINDHATVVLMAEAPNRQTEKRLTSCRWPSTDVSLHDLEKQHVEEASIQDSFEPTSRIPDNMDDKEIVNNEDRVYYNSRNVREGFNKSRFKVMEDHEVHELETGTSSSQGPRRTSSRDFLMGQEGIPFVLDTWANSSSNEKHGVKKDEAAKLGQPRRQKRGSHKQVRQVSLNNGSERNSVDHTVEERKELILLPKASELGKVQRKTENTSRDWSIQRNGEEFRSPKVAELFVTEKEPLVFAGLERNSGLPLNNAARHSAEESLQKHGGKMEANFMVEQVQSFETKQLTEPIAGSSVHLLSEKVGRLHVSSRQKNLKGHRLQPNSNNPNKVVKNIMPSAMEENLDVSFQSRKNGGKQSRYGSKGLMQWKGHVIDEKITDTLSPMDFKFIELNSVVGLEHEAEANAIEQGVSRNLRWQQKNVRIGGSASKTNVTRLGTKDEACEEISDCFAANALSSSQTSYPLSPRNNVKHFPKAAFRASQNHNNYSVKLRSDPTSSHEHEATFDCKHQEMRLMEAAVNSEEAISGKMLNDLNTETRRTIRQNKGAFQAFRHPHQAESECRVEQRNRVRRPSSRCIKPVSQRHFNGCSTAAELDRIDAETAIKTGISY